MKRGDGNRGGTGDGIEQSPAEVANTLRDLDGTYWVAVDLRDGPRIERAVAVDGAHHERADRGSIGRVWLSAETTDDERNRLDLPSVVLNIEATERRPDEWERGIVHVYGGGGGSEYDRLGEIASVEVVAEHE